MNQYPSRAHSHGYRNNQYTKKMINTSNERSLKNGNRKSFKTINILNSVVFNWKNYVLIS